MLLSSLHIEVVLQLRILTKEDCSEAAAGKGHPLLLITQARERAQQKRCSPCMHLGSNPGTASGSTKLRQE